MSKKVQTAMCPTASVRLDRVTKTFIQWQKDPAAKSSLRNLLKSEKRVITALDNVSLTVAPGEFLAYAGPNGAGKSTTMKLLSGMLLPNSGEISVLGLSPEKKRQALMSRLGVLFGNRTELWRDLPVIQSYEWKKVIWNIPEAAYQRRLAMVTELLGLEKLLTTFARELSLGQRMRADLGMLLLHSPELLLLDEPTLGLDVVAKRQMIEFLKTINQEDQVTILVTSHDMDDLEEMARRIVMISDGRLVYDGSFAGLRDTAGSPTHVTVTMDEGAPAPSLSGAALLTAENSVFTFEIDLAQHSTRHLLSQLATVDGVRDVEIGKAPIEQVIAELYGKWKA